MSVDNPQVKLSGDLSKTVGAKFMLRFSELSADLKDSGNSTFSVKIKDWESSEALKKLKPLFSQETDSLSSSDLIGKLKELLRHEFSKFYQFSTKKELERAAQIRTMIEILKRGLAQKLAQLPQDQLNSDAANKMKKHLKTLTQLERSLPKSTYARKRNARIGKILNKGWFAALGIFSWVVHLKNLGVHYFINPSNVFAPPVAAHIPTQGFKYFYRSIVFNNLGPFFSNFAAIFNQQLTRFTRSLKALKFLSSAAYIFSGISSVIGLAAAKSFLSLYSAGISQFSTGLLTKAATAGKTMVKFLAIGALLGIVASSIAAGIALLKFGQSAWKSWKGNDEEKVRHQGKLAKRGSSFVGNALMAIGFGVALVSGPIGWSLLGAGALFLVGLKVTQLVKSYQAKKIEERAFQAAVSLDSNVEKAPSVVGDAPSHNASSVSLISQMSLKPSSPSSVAAVVGTPSPRSTNAFVLAPGGAARAPGNPVTIIGEEIRYV
jgi:hypothetical protein